MKIYQLSIIAALAVLLVSQSFAASDEGPGESALRLINALGCKGCHKLKGDGGELAPELDEIGSRMTRAQISQHMAAHSKTRKNGFMPSYNTTPEKDLNTISDFLYHLK